MTASDLTVGYLSAISFTNLCIAGQNIRHVPLLSSSLAAKRV